MDGVETLEVLLTSSNDKQSGGTIEIQRWTEPERKHRALKTLGVCWGIAAVTVIFPVVHFVAVPGFFLGGPIAAFFIWAQEAKILGSRCTCPSCGQPFPVAKVRPQWPLSDVCSHCHEAIRVTPRPEPRPSWTGPPP